MPKPIPFPRTNSALRTVADFLYSESNRDKFGLVDATPLLSKYPRKRLHWMIARLVREYLWYIKPFGTSDTHYIVGKWCEFDFDLKNSDRLDHKVFYPDDRYRLPQRDMSTKFRTEPTRGTEIGHTYRFLLTNRTPGTGVVNVQSLYERFGPTKVQLHFRDLRRYYGFVITKATSEKDYNYTVDRHPNIKTKLGRQTPHSGRVRDQ